MSAQEYAEQLPTAAKAADDYRRLVELLRPARKRLIESAQRESDVINVSGLSRRAGLHHDTLKHWIAHSEERNGDGGK